MRENLAVTDANSVRARSFLKKHTADAHDALEAHPLMTRLATAPTWSTLTQALVRQAGWYAAMEPAIERGLGDCTPPDMAQRWKTPLLREDLAALGIAFEDLARCDTIPDLASAEAALGAVYVLEGASLGGAILSRRLIADLGARVPHRFFDPYGTDRGLRWRNFLDHLERCLERPEARRVAAHSALATFGSLLGWLERWDD